MTLNEVGFVEQGSISNFAQSSIIPDSLEISAPSQDDPVSNEITPVITAEPSSALTETSLSPDISNQSSEIKDGNKFKSFITKLACFKDQKLTPNNIRVNIKNKKKIKKKILGFFVSSEKARDNRIKPISEAGPVAEGTGFGLSFRSASYPSSSTRRTLSRSPSFEDKSLSSRNLSQLSILRSQSLSFSANLNIRSSTRSVQLFAHQYKYDRDFGSLQRTIESEDDSLTPRLRERLKRINRENPTLFVEILRDALCISENFKEKLTSLGADLKEIKQEKGLKVYEIAISSNSNIYLEQEKGIEKINGHVQFIDFLIGDQENSLGKGTNTFKLLEKAIKGKQLFVYDEENKVFREKQYLTTLFQENPFSPSFPQEIPLLLECLVTYTQGKTIASIFKIPTDFKERDEWLAKMRNGCYTFLQKYQTQGPFLATKSLEIVRSLERNIYLLNLFPIEIDHLYNTNYRKVFEPNRQGQVRFQPEDLALCVIRGKESNSLKGHPSLMELSENAVSIKLFGLKNTLIQLVKKSFLDNAIRVNLILECKPWLSNQSAQSPGPIDQKIHQKMVRICNDLSLSPVDGNAEEAPLIHNNGLISYTPRELDLSNEEIQQQHEQIAVGAFREARRNDDLLFENKTIPARLTSLYTDLLIQSTTIRQILLTRKSFTLIKDINKFNSFKEDLKDFFKIVNTVEKVVIERIVVEQNLNVQQTSLTSTKIVEKFNEDIRRPLIEDLKKSIDFKLQTNLLTQEFGTKQKFETWVDQISVPSKILSFFNVYLKPISNTKKSLKITNLETVEILLVREMYNYKLTNVSQQVLMKRKKQD